MNRILLLVVVATALAACSAAVGPASPTAGPAASPTAVAGPVTPPQATATRLPPPITVTSPVRPTAAFTATVSVLPSGDLTNAGMAAILHDSFTAYPWLMHLEVTDASATGPISGTIEAQSPVRVQTAIEKTVDSNQVVIDTIVISPTLYVKVTGLPASVLQAMGLTPGQWATIQAGQDTLGLTNIALAVADPARLLANIGYENLLNEANPNAKPFVLIGTERIEGVLTNVYELQLASGSTTMTIFHVAVGAADGHVYQIQSEGPQQMATATMQYDAAFTVEPPVP